MHACERAHVRACASRAGRDEKLSLARACHPRVHGVDFRITHIKDDTQQPVACALLYHRFKQPYHVALSQVQVDAGTASVQ